MVSGLKDIENRDWTTNYRGPLLIHAGKQMDYTAYRFVAEHRHLSLPALLPTGGIVGQVDLIDVVQESDSPWFEGRYGFVLRNAHDLPFVTHRGQLGIFPVARSRLAPAVGD